MIKYINLLATFIVQKLLKFETVFVQIDYLKYTNF